MLISFYSSFLMNSTTVAFITSKVIVLNTFKIVGISVYIKNHCLVD